MNIKRFQISFDYTRSSIDLSPELRNFDSENFGNIARSRKYATIENADYDDIPIFTEPYR
jgi:hypothetical protein